MRGEQLSLEGVKWNSFLISDIAEIISGRGIYDDERIPGNIPYVTASAMNNGVTYFTGSINDTLESECISVNSNGSVGYAFYHPYEALYSSDCRKLRPKYKNKYTSIFIAVSITSQRGKYNYGYKLGTARLMRQKILLPVNENCEPDYIFMERFMRQTEQKLIQEYISVKYATGGGVKLLRDIKNWPGIKLYPVVFLSFRNQSYLLFCRQDIQAVKDSES